MRLAFLLPILIVAACSRTEPAAPGRIALPATCSKQEFGAAIDALDTFSFRRDEILARADTYPSSEPADYRRRVEQDEREFGELAERARAVFVPRCLQKAKEIYATYLEKSREALEARRPADEPAGFRQKLETANTVYAQFRTEVAQQWKNAQ